MLCRRLPSILWRKRPLWTVVQSVQPPSSPHGHKLKSTVLLRSLPLSSSSFSFFSSDTTNNSNLSLTGTPKKNKRPRSESNGMDPGINSSTNDVLVDCAPYASSDAPPHTLYKPSVETNSQSNTTAAPQEPPQQQRLPAVPTDWKEFPIPPLTATQNRYRATARIARLAVQRVVEPPTLHFMGAAMGMAVLVGGVEAALMCQVAPWLDTTSSYFCICYSLQNLFPSVVWQTQDAVLICTAMGLDSATVLHDLSGTTPESAVLLLQTQWLSTSRFFFAGFMMIAQLFRAATIFMESFEAYANRIQQGHEPPLYIRDGLVIRFCGIASHVTEVSLPRMAGHLFPVLEQPTVAHQHLVQLYSQGLRRPVYWSVPTDKKYGRPYVWENFPVSRQCWVKIMDTRRRSTISSTTIHRSPNTAVLPVTAPDHAQSSSAAPASSSTSSVPPTPPQQPKRVLILEADATNGNDPLTIGEAALDLTVEDASQGFRRILDRYRNHANLHVGRDFQVLRVYLGNSMETTTTGGGYAYTLRHRVRYAKEMDVLIDSRAPVLRKILEWCESVAAPHGNKLFFQTSSRSYFLNLQTLLKEYGYEIYDPLDVRMLPKLRQALLGETSSSANNNKNTTTPSPESRSDTMDVIRPSTSLWRHWLLGGSRGQTDGLEEEEWRDHGAFLKETFQNGGGTIATGDDNQQASKSSATAVETPHDMLRLVARLARLPRLVHMETTAQTVNAVEAMLAAGEVDASICCALLDRHEGVAVLEATMQHQSDFVQSHRFQWQKEVASSNSSSRSDEETDETNASLSTSGLHIICSSTIHDEMFRQVRYWVRQGYSAREIQKELDTQYREILQQSHTVQKQVAKDVGKEEQATKGAATEGTSSSDHVEMPEGVDSSNGSVDAQEVEPPPSTASAARSSSDGETKTQ